MRNRSSFLYFTRALTVVASYDQQRRAVCVKINFSTENVFGTAPNNDLYRHVLADLPVTKNGYLYIYVYPQLVGGKSAMSIRSGVAAFDISYQPVSTGIWKPVQTIGT